MGRTARTLLGEFIARRTSGQIYSAPMEDLEMLRCASEVPTLAILLRAPVA